MSARRIPVEFMSSVRAERQEKIATFEVSTPETGRLFVHHGDMVFVGETGEPGNMRISIICAMKGCGCGCQDPGRGVLYTPSPANARMLAAQLIEQADKIEREATTLATTMLAKARGK